MTERAAEAVNLSNLRDKELGLRRSVDETRVRLRRQSAALRELRSSLAELRRLAAQPPPSPAAEDSAPPKPWARTRLVPYAALAVFALAYQFTTHRPPPPTEIAPRAALSYRSAPLDEDGDRGNEAIALVCEWRAPGDDRPLLERVLQPTEPPGTPPAWRAERTGEVTYRVTFHPADADSSLDFEVDLDARRVDPLPETAGLLAPRLTARR